MNDQHNEPANPPVNNVNNILVLRFNKKKREHDELVKWLKSYCDNSDNAFKDQNYSDTYKAMFNLTDNNENFYEKNDIDHEINIGYVDYEPEEQKDPKDEELEQFIDHVPNGLTDSSYYNIVILPGTNHSNANYIYKMIKNETINHKFKIPYISNNPKIPYNGDIKDADMMISKSDVYAFVKDNSKNRRY